MLCHAKTLTALDPCARNRNAMPPSSLCKTTDASSKDKPTLAVYVLQVDVYNISSSSPWNPVTETPPASW